MSNMDMNGELHEGLVTSLEGEDGLYLKVGDEAYLAVGALVSGVWEGRNVRVTVDVQDDPPAWDMGNLTIVGFHSSRDVSFQPLHVGSDERIAVIGDTTAYIVVKNSKGKYWKLAVPPDFFADYAHPNPAQLLRRKAT